MGCVHHGSMVLFLLVKLNLLEFYDCEGVQLMDLHHWSFFLSITYDPKHGKSESLWFKAWPNNENIGFFAKYDPIYLLRFTLDLFYDWFKLPSTKIEL